MIEKFGYDFKDDDGLFEYIYWITNDRFFRQVRWTHNDGTITTDKPRRISEKAYMSAYETYRNY